MVNNKIYKKNDIMPIMTNIRQNWQSIDSVHLSLAEAFTNGYNKRITVSELSKKARIPIRTAFRKIKLLQDIGFLSYEISGKNKIYCINKNHQITKTLIMLIEANKTIKFIERHPKISIVLDKLSEKNTIIIFGSFANNTQKNNSDIDIVIFEGIKEENIIIQVPAHIQRTSYDKFKKTLTKKNALAMEIYDNHIIFGDIRKIVNLFIRV